MEATSLSHYIMVPYFYNAKFPYCSVCAIGKKHVYGKRSWCFLQEFGGRREKCKCHPYGNDTRVMKMSLPVHLQYAHRVGGRFSKGPPDVPSPRDYREEAVSFFMPLLGNYD